MVSVVVVPYLLWRWTGTRRSRIRRARAAGSREAGPQPVGVALAALVDLGFLAVVHVLVHAAAGSHLAAGGVVAVVAAMLVVLVQVLPRHGRTHRLLLVDDALRSLRRAESATAPR